MVGLMFLKKNNSNNINSSDSNSALSTVPVQLALRKVAAQQKKKIPF